MSDIGTQEAEQETRPMVLPVWAVGVPAALLIGFLTLLGRAGVGIEVLGLPIGAYLTPLPTALTLALVATTGGRRLLRALDPSERLVAAAVAVAVAVGLLRAAAQGMPTLLTFQDMAYLLHLPWIVVGMAAMRALPSDEERASVVRWLTWTITIVLMLHWARGVLAPVGWLFDQLVGGLDGVSDKPGNLQKDGDRALYGVMLATLVLFSYRRRVSLRFVVVAGLLAGTHLAGFFLGGSRGALLGTLLGLLVLVIQKPRRPARVALTAAIAASFMVLVATNLLAPPGQDAPLTTPPTNGPQSLLERYESAAGRRSITATMEQLQFEDGELSASSTIGWRLAIWADVIEEWNSSWTNRLAGIGFGNEINAMTVPGRQGYDGTNRGVHNIVFTILARQGLLGLAAASLLLLVLVFPQRRVVAESAPILVTAITVALFDVFLEGVQAPIVLWVVIGLLGYRMSPVEPSSISSKSST